MALGLHRQVALDDLVGDVREKGQAEQDEGPADDLGRGEVEHYGRVDPKSGQPDAGDRGHVQEVAGQKPKVEVEKHRREQRGRQRHQVVAEPRRREPEGSHGKQHVDHHQA